MRHSFLYLIATLSLASLVGCGSSRKTTIQFLAGGKPVVYALKGDVVQWIGPDGSALPVTFPVGSPCQPGGPASTCTVQETGAFPYECTGCSDPGVVVGSDNGRPPSKAMSSTTVADAQLGYVYCDKTTKAAKVYPDPLPAPAATAGGDSTVQWLPLGGSGISTYAIGVQSGTCKEGMIDQSQDVCTLVVGAPSQTYMVTADTCSMPGTAVLTIH
jgi:hypothetical protein